jgi:hypothetical protein
LINIDFKKVSIVFKSSFPGNSQIVNIEGTDVDDDSVVLMMETSCDEVEVESIVVMNLFCVN